MKALTICQPYAELLMPRGPLEPPRKRTENRTWATRYRGPLAIHAGKSREWLKLYKPYADHSDADWRELQRDRLYGIDLNDMTFGAVIGVAELIDCLPIDEIRSGGCDERYDWIRNHAHAQGPWCFVIANVRRLAEPLPYKGQQGFFNVPDKLLQAAR